MYPGEHARTTPDRPAIIMAGSGETLSFAELDRRANRLAHLFRDMGLRRKDHVAFLVENHIELLVAMSAAERTGLYYTPINAFLSAAEAAYIVNDSGALLVLSSRAKREVAADLPALCPAVRRWIMLDVDAPTDGFEPYAAAVAPFPDTPVPDERLGTPMFYSSGTTGVPKAIVRGLPDRDPGEMLDIEAFGRQVFHLREGGMVFLSPAPLYHSGPQSSVAIALRLGGTSVVMEKFDAETYLALVQQFGVTHSMVVPTMFSRLLKLPAVIRERYDLSTLEAVVHGAAPCPMPVKQAMLEWWGPVIYEYYGATEANGITGCGPEEWLAHPGTVGRPILGEAVILDDDGRPCPPGVPGTIWFRGGNSNFEYLNDPEKTAAARHPSGTMTMVGDIGYLDEDGYLYLTDRHAFVIISGGVNIYPQEVENLLVSHPWVMDAAVIGVPDDDKGEAVKGVVQLVDGIEAGPATEKALIDHCRSALARFKCPRSIDFVDELPRLPTGKLYKRKLRDTYWPAAEPVSAQ
ncbi:AMP-binding protein [Nakamurella sp. YIM 132087]|uniref:AMP-binding protein n=1 Tax=Nakamurella alba TaxID=2665158 RepID=A0A7K1FG32_9ACTN|nr:AMP-binding protein [Nakamurella alba]MTD13026.1 AMP-binding protein [Nakamurella alba]